MDQKNNLTRKGKKYLKKLVTTTRKSQQSQKVMNKKIEKIQLDFKAGDLKIQGKPQKIQDLLEKREDPSSIRFYLYTDRTKNRQMYQEMRKIRQEYSHQKTSLVVQEVQKKIKDWTLKQQIADRKRLQYFQQKIKEEQEIMQKTKIQKKSWRQMQEINHHQEVVKRLERLRQKKQQRQEQLKESNVKFKQTMQQVPLYVLKQRQWRQKQHELDSKLKSMSKKNSISFEGLNIKEHEKNYLQILKQRQMRRQKSLSSLSRINTPKYKNHKVKDNQSKIHVISEQAQIQDVRKNQNPETYSQTQSSSKQFVTYFKLSEELKNEQEAKRQRRKQFVQRIKQLKPDQKIISRIKARNSQQKLSKQMEALQKKKKNIPVQSQIKKIGNQYLKQLTQNKQKVKRMENSVSLPTIKPPASRYPDYLTQFKQKSVKSGRKLDQIQKLKQRYKEPQQVMQQLNKKSKQYEGTILKKIKQLQRIKPKKYDEHLKKQLQIDELFYKSLKMRLACLQIS